MRKGWEEINPRKNGARRNRRPYITLRPRWGKIYFSYALMERYFSREKRVIIRYNREMNMLSFLPTVNGDMSYSMTGVKKRTVTARNVFKMMGGPKVKKSFFVRYNEEAKWLEVHLGDECEGEMKWLKA